MAGRLTALLTPLILVLLVLDSATLVYSILEGMFPSVVERGAPTAYRNLYVHVPVSISAYTVLTLAAISALAYMISRRQSFYELLDVSIKVGLPLGVASLLTGSIWASESWGSLWTWDPRQVSVLILVLAYTLYFAIKNSVRDPDMRPLVSSAYAFAAYATIPLSFIIPRIAESLHPTPEQTREFIAGAPELFITRIALVTILSLSIVTLLKWDRGGSRVIPMVSLVLLATITLISLYGLAESTGLLGATGRVVDARIEDGRLWVKVEGTTGVYEGYYEGSPPIEPLQVSVNGGVRVTLVDNIIRFDYSNNFFENMRVVNHPVVYINAVIYTILAYTPLILGRRLVGGGV